MFLLLPRRSVLGTGLLAMLAMAPLSEGGPLYDRLLVDDAVSRLVTVYNSRTNPGAIGDDAVSRAVTIWCYWPPSTVRDGGENPAEFTVRPPQPNPFTGETALIFGLPREAPASLTVYDAGGRRIGEVAPEGRFRAGWHAMKFGDRSWPQGVYFYRFQSEANVRTGKVVLSR